jgi:protease I
MKRQQLLWRVIAPLLVVVLLAACGEPLAEPAAMATPVPPTSTPVLPTATPIPPTATPIPPTATPARPTSTPIPQTLAGKQVLLVIQEHFNATEYGVPRNLVELRGATTVVAAPSLDRVTAYAAAAQVQPDIMWSDVQAADYDMIVFVGGYPYDDDDPEMHRIAQEAVAGGKMVAGICNGVITMAKAGVLKGKKVTLLLNHSDKELKEGGAIVMKKAVQRDGLVITANGPDASRKFAETIVAALEE